MKTLDLEKMEQVKGGLSNCTEEVLWTAGTVIFSAAVPGGFFFGLGRIAVGIAQGSALYDACFG